MKWQASPTMRPPAHGRVLGPVIRGNRPRVHRHHEGLGSADASEKPLDLLDLRRKSPVEADHHASAPTKLPSPAGREEEPGVRVAKPTAGLG